MFFFNYSLTIQFFGGSLWCYSNVAMNRLFQNWLLNWIYLHLKQIWPEENKWWLQSWGMKKEFLNAIKSQHCIHCIGFIPKVSCETYIFPCNVSSNVLDKRHLINLCLMFFLSLTCEQETIWLDLRRLKHRIKVTCMQLFGSNLSSKTLPQLYEWKERGPPQTGRTFYGKFMENGSRPDLSFRQLSCGQF